MNSMSSESRRDSLLLLSFHSTFFHQFQIMLFPSSAQLITLLQNFIDTIKQLDMFLCDCVRVANFRSPFYVCIKVVYIPNMLLSFNGAHKSEIYWKFTFMKHKRTFAFTVHALITQTTQDFLYFPLCLEQRKSFDGRQAFAPSQT